MVRKGWKTRKQLVLEYLQAHPNEWVSGLDMMNERVGGLRASGRIHELRGDGYNIERRPSKTSAVHEYRLVVAKRPPVYVQMPLMQSMKDG